MRKYISLFILCFIIAVPTFGQTNLVYPDNNFVFEVNSVDFEWDEYSNAVNYTIQVATDIGFTILLTNTSTVATSHEVLNLPVNQEFFWRIKANNSTWSETRTFRIVDFKSWPELEMWLNADSITPVSGDKINEWIDLSSNYNHFSQLNSLNQPSLLYSNDEINNHNKVEFKASQNNFLDGVDLSHLNNGEVFSLLNITSTSGASNERGIWSFGTASAANVYPWTDNSIYMGFGRNIRFNIGDIIGMPTLTKPHILNISSGPSFVFKINNTLIFNSTSGTPSFRNNVLLGHSGGSYYLDGSISEIILFNSVLPDSLRDLTHAYLRHKYAPPVNLGPNITQYGFCDTTLYAGKRFDSYLWSDGSTADSLIVSEPGTYWVETVDIFGFTSSDTIEVIFPEFQHPTSQLYCPSEFIDWQTGLGEHYNYLWSDGSTADSLVINSPGSYHVTVTDTNGCVFQSDTLVFDEDPFTATASLGPDVNLCTGNNLGLSVGANEAVSYLWNTGATTPEIGISSSGTYNVQVQNANGCVAMDTIDVTIIGDAPNIAFDVPAQSCVAASFDFEDLSTTTDGSSIIAWDWNFGEGSTENVEQGNFAYSADGNYDITLTIETSSGCFNTLSAPIEIKTNPILTFSTNYICQNQSIEFNGGQLSPQTITDWNWNFNDPASGTNNVATGQNTQHVFASPGDYDVMLIGTDIFGCIDTLVQTKTIAPTPTADFNFNEVCEGSVVNYQNASTVASPATITSYQWTFGDGTNSGQTNPQKPYASQGVYTVGLTATANNGCSDDTTQTIKIHAIPQVNYTLEQACAGIDAQFIDNSFIPNGSVAQVDWSIDGQTSITGFTVGHQFPNAGTYSLEQTVRSAFGCENSAVSSVTIKDYIDADFDFSPNAFVSDYPIVFQSTSTGASQYEWTFGDFANAQQADTSITFDESQIGNTYTVELLVRNIHGCSDSMTIQGTVLERQTDLLISQLFSQEENGYLTIGVQLKNIGTTPINRVDLYLRKPSLSGGIKETWSGNLQAGQSEIYVFSAAPSATVMDKDADQNYLCIEGRIVSPAQFTELDLENNEVCRVIAPSEVVLIHPYPNPVSDQLTIKVVMPAKEVIALHVYNDQGRLVHTVTEEEELQKGLNTFYVNTSGWAAGNYKIRTITSTKQVPTVGFVKL
ncbi:PKD domain-containing protein [Brumimicrobium sp.]|uniref:PKD domain-containing protein n=1 Tax=Brumimicrobium sp. TaxID=2029867 RepID=UPI003A91DA11